MNEEAASPSFKEGELIVYPGHGLVRVVKIGLSDLLSGEVVYTLLFWEKIGGELLVPVRNEKLVRLRKLSGPAEVRRALQCLRIGQIEIIHPWRQRVAANEDRINRGSLMDLAEALRMMNLVYREKPIFGREKELYKKAAAFFRDEIRAEYGEEESRRQLNGILKKF